MTAKFMATFLLACLSLPAHADQTITGTNHRMGDISLDCTDIAPLSPQVAEDDAEAQAEKYCSTFNLAPVRSSDFKYSQSGCYREGHGFAIHMAKNLYATANYKCLSPR